MMPPAVAWNSEKAWSVGAKMADAQPEDGLETYEHSLYY